MTIDGEPQQPAITPENWPGLTPKPENERKKKKKRLAPHTGANRKAKRKRPARKFKGKPVYHPPWDRNELPERAAAQVERDWVLANLFHAKEDKDDGTFRINWGACMKPPPSHAAVLLMKVAAKKTEEFVLKHLAGAKNVADPHEMKRRDKMQVEEIREILQQFEDAGKK